MGKLPVPSEESSEKFTARDGVQFFGTHYARKFGVSYGRITIKDLKLMKELLNDYEKEHVIKAIMYLVYTGLPEISGNAPSVGVLYGYRRTIFPRILGATQTGPIENRQYKEDKWNPEDGF